MSENEPFASIVKSNLIVNLCIDKSSSSCQPGPSEIGIGVSLGVGQQFANNQYWKPKVLLGFPYFYYGYNQYDS